MNTISPWAATVQTDILKSNILLEKKVSDYLFQMYDTGDSAWLTVQWPSGGKVALRAVYGLNSTLKVDNLLEDADAIVLQFSNEIGKFEVRLYFPQKQEMILHYTTTFRPDAPILIPFWPRDIVALAQNGKSENTSGKIYIDQTGTRSGLLYAAFTKPKTGSFLYFQNLTSMSPYCDATQTSLGNTVGGQWPEIGFQLPQVDENPLPDKTFVISDAYIRFTDNIPSDEVAIAKSFLENLAAIYSVIPKPETNYNDWQHISECVLHDLTDNKGCWSYANMHPYLNAYLCDFKTPPEIMVQLAVLYAVAEHAKWSGEKYAVIKDLKRGLDAFYDSNLQTISRWLPSQRAELDESEEQKSAMVMDSWYLHHPLMNLSKLALDGDQQAKTLLMKSLNYAIKVAHHYNYEWPVFYKMDTLETVKRETVPGKGGEKDVAGSYALLMHNVWKLTGEKRYLKEATKAADKLRENGLHIFYQANNTAFSALAMLRLYIETGEEKYLETSYLCLAGILRNVQLWECDYGYAKNFDNFFGIFPLGDAPYKAAYEEMEVYAAINDYIREADAANAPIPSALQLLLPELVRYSVNRLPAYYPTMLPVDILSEDVKTGEIDPTIWIPLEDLYDGWEKPGQVGQEVYGAGVGFGVVPRQYHKVKGERFMVYCDYPVQNFRSNNYKSAFFKTLGDVNMQCKMQIMSETKLKHSDFVVSTEASKKETYFKPIKQNTKMMEYDIPGNTVVKIKWK